ncbi:enoyl-CoA hydratase-related protein [Oceanobacillus salinisoli]|uniref:enoyl-CoA hydratase-related protein n=1 Tax=Oceanobacillus salinisoli TaxID=2678611 RepID=UPI0012E1700A|nr:enoyl-CoA hydratase-related protein [Oceanobacillus salinisoli]
MLKDLSLETIKLELIGKVLIITLNRPGSLNAVSKQLTYEMDECLKAAEENPEIWAMIITGAGRAFSAGADLKELSQKNSKSYPEPTGGFAGIVEANLSKPIIAAVNGLAHGGGAEIALASDIVIASENAIFAFPEVKRGIIAAAGGLLRLPRQIPQKIAMQMVLTGKELSAHEMERWGMVNEVVTQENLLKAALEQASAIAENAPLAVQASKRLLLEGMDLPLHHSNEAWELNQKTINRIRNTEDALEGPMAFAEKRPPAWNGK